MLSLPLALALALAAEPVPAPGTEPPPPPVEPVEPAEVEETFPFDDPEPRLDLTLWGGQTWTERGTGLRGETYTAEATWRFDSVDVGLLGGAYALRHDASGNAVEPYYAPVCLVRIGQRFETRNGLLANFTFGIGTIKATEWRSWFQVALGARANFGPAFVAGELSFESDDIIRVAIGLGVSLF